LSKQQKHIFITEWRRKVRKILKRMHPEISKKEINLFLDEIIKNNLNNPECIIDNNYANVSIKSSLLEVYDWVKTTKPICGGFGVFYKNQHEVINPLAIMIQKFLTSRKLFKGKLRFIPDKTSYEYKTYDRKQMSEKVNANSIYGTFGNAISFLHNKYTAPSVTGTGQSLISTTELAFESFMANNVAFNNINECMSFISNILDEEYSHDVNILPDVSISSVLSRIINMFYDYRDSYTEIIYEYLSSLSQIDLNKIYYKNNLYEFSNIDIIQQILTSIIYNSTEFKDPNKVPESIEGHLKELWEYYKDFVFYNHSPINRIQRLKNDKRKCVITIDTDSNMLNLNPWVEYMFNTIINPNDDFSNRDREELRFISINTMSYIITNMIGDSLGKYTLNANIPEEYRDKINMKNEFLFSRMILSNKKKKYVSSIRLREGDEIFPEKIDIKGHEFMKSTATEETKSRFQNIVQKRVLQSKEINISTILQDLELFENEIMKSLENGDRTYLIPKSVKELGAYTEPLKEQGVRAIITWNYLHPDMSIELPAKVDIVKLTLTQESELQKLKYRNREIYDIIEKNILNHPDKRISSKGVPVIAIPRNLDKIPDWILEFIDYDTLAYNVLKKFYPILASLGLETIKTSKKEYFSNIINL